MTKGSPENRANGQEQTETNPKAAGKPKGKRWSAKLRQANRYQKPSLARDKKMIELKMRGNTTAEIAQAMNLCPAAIHKSLSKFQPLFEELRNVRDYRAVRGDILDAATLTFLKKAVDDEKLDKASVSNLMYAARMAYDMQRLDSGKPTSIEASCRFTATVRTDNQEQAADVISTTCKVLNEK